MDDIYDTYPRANTMFKFTFQGFIVLNILVSLFFSLFIPYASTLAFFNVKGQSFNDLLASRSSGLMSKIILRRGFCLYLPMLVFVMMALLYAKLGYNGYYGHFKQYRSLNGLAWLSDKHPDDFALMEFLRDREPQQVNIIEAVGDSYTEYDRVSAFSGMPTVVGWRVHEWLWRGTWDLPATRSGEVETIYLQPTSANAQQLLQQYKVKYIVVGDLERSAYPDLAEAALQSLGEIVFQSGQSYLIELPMVTSN